MVTEESEEVDVSSDTEPGAMKGARNYGQESQMDMQGAKQKEDEGWQDV